MATIKFWFEFGWKVIVKMKLYKGSEQNNNTVDLWESIKTTTLEIEPAKIKY